jgi:hypothetical protein
MKPRSRLQLIVLALFAALMPARACAQDVHRWEDLPAVVDKTMKGASDREFLTLTKTGKKFRSGSLIITPAEIAFVRHGPRFRASKCPRFE